VWGQFVEGYEIVVASQFGFGQPGPFKNGRLLGGEPGALRDGAVAGVLGVELDAVELGRKVAPGVVALQSSSAVRISSSASHDSCM
jgi:hypothetical protein